MISKIDSLEIGTYFASHEIPDWIWLLSSGILLFIVAVAIVSNVTIIVAYFRTKWVSIFINKRRTYPYTLELKFHSCSHYLIAFISYLFIVTKRLLSTANESYICWSNNGFHWNTNWYLREFAAWMENELLLVQFLRIYTHLNR